MLVLLTLYASGPQHQSPAGFHSGHQVSVSPGGAKKIDLKSNHLVTEDHN